MLKRNILKLKTSVWMYEGFSAWHFATINKSVASKIKDMKLTKRGWGSVPVYAQVGNTRWKTSIFPDKEGVYLLPIKKSVRLAENIKVGRKIVLNLEIIEDYFQEQI